MAKLQDIVGMLSEDEQKRKHSTWFLILKNSTEAVQQLVIMTRSSLQLMLLYLDKCKGHSDVKLTKLICVF